MHEHAKQLRHITAASAPQHYLATVQNLHACVTVADSIAASRPYHCGSVQAMPAGMHDCVRLSISCTGAACLCPSSLSSPLSSESSPHAPSGPRGYPCTPSAARRSLPPNSGLRKVLSRILQRTARLLLPLLWMSLTLCNCDAIHVHALVGGITVCTAMSRGLLCLSHTLRCKCHAKQNPITCIAAVGETPPWSCA